MTPNLVASRFALVPSAATITLPPFSVTKSYIASASVSSIGFSGAIIRSMVRWGSFQSLTSIGVDIVLAMK